MTHPVYSQFTPPTASRALHPTMGQGVAERTYLRRVFTDQQHKELLQHCEENVLVLNMEDPRFEKWMVAASNSGWYVATDEHADHFDMDPETRWEDWHDVAHRVAVGNVSLLDPDNGYQTNPALWSSAAQDYHIMSRSIANGSLLMSGRHLQQGDENQPGRNMEVFSNCATAATSFALFGLLLNGSGVGRDYSDRMMLVDWAANMPNVVVVLKDTHPDFVWGKHTTPREAKHLYKTAKSVLYHAVKDSREGWAKAVEVVEMVAFRNANPLDNHVQTVILDFSEVRGKGAPIMGMQGRPSSGPVPLMDAFEKVAKIKGTGLKPWLATLYIDHYLAEPVLVGGARRSARMSTKNWRDPDIIEFIGVKRPVEFDGLAMKEVIEVRRVLDEAGLPKPLSFLWSSNNSVAVDEEFWSCVNGPITADPLTQHAKMAFEYACQCGYGDGNGEPGFINVDRLAANMDGLDADVFKRGEWFGSEKYQPGEATQQLLASLYKAFMAMDYHFIVNPCGEIALSILGGFCVIADVVPFHANSICEAIEVAEAAARALVRVNLMDSVYNAEVRRTNRIGVGVTGIHEAAWKFFGCGFNDLVNPDFAAYAAARDAEGPDNLPLHPDRGVRAASFWNWLGNMSKRVQAAATAYAEELGVAVPHTFMTVKPSGSVSKLFGLSEGWHLPAMLRYLRWVQYHKDSPMIAQYREAGYPVRELKSYKDHWIVGFPTEPAICTLPDVEGHLVTAGDASPEDQFQWLMYGEFFLLEGGSVADYLDAEARVDEGDYANVLDALVSERGRAVGNQISYTLKYRPEDTSFEAFKEALAMYQPDLRCVSVMPQENGASYEYLPEQPVSLAEYAAVQSAIRREGNTPSEDVGLEHLDCATGACPIAFTDAAKEDL